MPKIGYIFSGIVFLILISLFFVYFLTDSVFATDNNDIRELIRQEIRNLFRSEDSQPSFISEEFSDPVLDWVRISTDPVDNNLFSDFSQQFDIGLEQIDIMGVDYSSNERSLNSTLWLTTPITNNSKFDEVNYGILMDTDLDHSSGQNGFDYRIEVRRDTNNTWTKEIARLSSTGGTTVLEQVPQTDLSKRRDVFISTDLGAIGFPNRYNLVFYSNATITGLQFLDYTFVNHFPPPNPAMSTSPQSLLLRVGEQKTIEVVVNSSSDIDSNISPFIAQPTAYVGLRMNFVNNQTSVPPFGIATFPLVIKTEENTKPRPYGLPIGANVTFPSLSYLIYHPSQSKPIPVEGFESPAGSNMTLSVLPPLTVAEQFSEFLNTYSIAASFIPLIVTTVVSAIMSKVIDIRKSAALKQLGVTDVIQIDATVIAGVLIFLTIGTEFNKLALTYMTASIVYPFAISAIRAITKGSAESGIKLMMAGFVYLMVAIILISFI